MSVSFCLPHPVAVSAFMICRGLCAFMICRGLCACTEMLWMCGLYVSFGSKIRPITFGCVDSVVSQLSFWLDLFHIYFIFLVISQIVNRNLIFMTPGSER